MAVERLNEELRKIKPLVKEGKVRIWVTPRAEAEINAKTADELLAVTVDAFAKSARELGRQSEPFLMGHYENPDILFVGTRLSRGEPYLFVVQAAVGDHNWLRLMTEAFNEANKQ
jgi:hypothetical protein